MVSQRVSHERAQRTCYEKGMNILVTGATGLVGSRLCAKLLHQGHEVRALARDPAQAARKVTLPIQWVAWDSNLPLPQQALQGMDAVVHLAGESVANWRWSAARKKEIL